MEVEIVGDSRSLERAFGRASGASSGLGRSLRSLGKVAAVGLGAAFGGLAVSLKVGFDELSEGQKVAAQTNAVLKSTGGIANVTAKEVAKLAESQSRLTGIDDELIHTSENLLLTFKRVRNEVGAGNRIFDRATKSALDLSTAGFGSVESASKMLGKALNDPIRGMTALSRAGVTFSDDQKKAIRALVDSGRALQAQKLILREVESQVGGSAKAYGETLPGQLSKLRNAFEEVAAELALAFLPAVLKVLNGLNDLVGWVQTNMPKIKEVFGEVFGPVADFVSKAFDSISTSATGATTPLQRFGQTARAALESFRSAAEAAAPTVRVIMQSLRDLIVSVVIPTFERLLTVGRMAWEGIARVFRENGPEIQRIVERVGKLLEVLGRIIIFLADTIVIPILKPLFGVIIPTALGYTIKAIDAVSGAIEGMINAIRKVLGFAGKAFERVKTDIAGPLEFIRTLVLAVGQAVQYLLDRIAALADKAGDVADAVRSVLSGIGQLGGIGSIIPGIPGRAAGGPVSAGQPYIVGEAGPELFVPTNSGQIVPSNSTGSALGASQGSSAPTVILNVHGSVTSERELVTSIRDALIQMGRRNGGNILAGYG